MSQLARRKTFREAAWRDRDLSWLDFNRRVLSEALDKRTPLLERLKYLAIFTTNLDEFFMKRVGAMRTRAFASEDAGTIADFNAHVSRLRTALYPMLLEQAACYTFLRSKLVEHGIRLATWDELTDAQRTESADYFDAHISPALTPLSLDPSDPFPFMSNLSTSWGFVLRDTASGERQNVRVKVPNRIPQWLALRTDVPAGERCLLGLQDIVRRNAWKLFPGTEIEHATLFRVSRNADVALEDGADYSLRESVEEQVRQRRFQPVVRLEFSESPWPEVRDELMQRFELHEADVYELPGQLDYTDAIRDCVSAGAGTPR